VLNGAVEGGVKWCGWHGRGQLAGAYTGQWCDWCGAGARCSG